MTEKEALEKFVISNKQMILDSPILAVRLAWNDCLEWVKHGQEPVAIICPDDVYGFVSCTKDHYGALMVYTHPAPQPDVAELVEALKAFVFNSSCQVNYPDECERAERVLEKMEGKHGLR